MKEYWARKWIKDLETPGRKQATGTLRDGPGYCCLGRACVVAGVKPVKGTFKEWRFDNEESALPASVVEKFGMRSEDGKLPAPIEVRGMQCHTLISLNDDAGMKFKDIAKVIRKHWREL